MVSLPIVQSSNAQIPKTLPSGLVVVLTGGTSGIGEVTLKLLAKLLVSPKIYIIGRSQSAADRIIGECKELNPDGTFVFIQKSMELMKNVAEVADEIKSKEKKVNLLFHSAGGPAFGKEGRSLTLKESELYLLMNNSNI
jgi:NADP-dependent 3-hydroxy acid dehydrogenase YdfG